MNDKIVEYISSVDSALYDEYINNIDIKSTLNLDMQLNDYKCYWLDSLEEYLPFLSNIVNIDYVNTNTILKSYENRFIKTFLYRLYNFLLNEKKYIENISGSNSKSISSKIDNILGDEKIEIEISVKTTKISESTNGNSYELSLLERIDRAISKITNLINSNFIKSLDDLSIITNSEDIKKTIVFEQELNYKKSFELYEIIENYVKKREDSEICNTEDIIKNKLLVTSFLEYQLLKNHDKEINVGNSYKDFLERVIEKMVLEYSIDEKTFKKLITKKFEDEYNKKKSREKNIQNIFIKSIDNYNKQVKDALRILKG